MVFNREQTEKLMSFANSPSDFLETTISGDNLKANLARNGYGCEDKPYFVEFYVDTYDKMNGSKRLYGVIDNFQPQGQTAIRDENNDLWLIDSKLIKIMRPCNERELKNLKSLIV